MAVGPGLPNTVADHVAAGICRQCGRLVADVGALHAECARCDGTIMNHDPHPVECSLYTSQGYRAGHGGFVPSSPSDQATLDAQAEADASEDKAWSIAWCLANDTCRHCATDVEIVGALCTSCGRCDGETAGHLHQAHAMECVNNPLGENYQAPQVLSLSPADTATGQPRSVHPTATFSQEMDPAEITSTTVQLWGPGDTPVAQAGNPVLSGGGVIATITPASNLAATTLYRIHVTTGAKNTYGNPLAAAYTAEGFTTGS